MKLYRFKNAKNRKIAWDANFGNSIFTMLSELPVVYHIMIMKHKHYAIIINKNFDIWHSFPEMPSSLKECILAVNQCLCSSPAFFVRITIWNGSNCIPQWHRHTTQRYSTVGTMGEKDFHIVADGTVLDWGENDRYGLCTTVRHQHISTSYDSYISTNVTVWDTHGKKNHENRANGHVMALFLRVRF